MIRETLSHFHLPLLTCLGLLIFMTVFFGSLYWVFHRKNRDLYRYIEKLPFSEDHS